MASYDEATAQLTPLFNPRTQDWNEHFRLNGSEIAGRTPKGRVTVFLLQMNRDEQIETRRDLIDAGVW